MFKFFFSLLLLTLSLFGADKVDIYASKMVSKGEMVEASDGVTVTYKSYIITADRLLYNRKSSELELFNNIRVSNGAKYKMLGKYAKLNIAKKEKFFKPFFMLDKKTNLWMSANDGKEKDTLLTIHSGTLSGCNPLSPKWKIEYSSLNYNSEDKWTNVYNARLYIGDIPIFYTPYFTYPTDTTRRTGLLIPSIGISSSEGVYYSQSLYIAEQNWWDMQITPQIRTTRGKGIYQTFRFVDSPVSSGVVTTGYFKENESYVKKNNLKNREHYGLNFKYTNSNFINSWFATHLRGQSAIYADISYMNDVDYINLASNDTENSTTATQILSRINLFYNQDNYYLGSYFKYYQNLTYTTQEQKKLLQKLPTLQYHKYLNTFLENHLLYNLDIQTTNNYRQIGKKVQQTDIDLPVTLQTTLADEYLNLSYTADIYMQHSKFSGSDNGADLNLKDGYYARNSHTVSLFTQLTKGYENGSHVISFGLTYKQPGQEKREGYYKNNQNCQISSDAPECEFYNISSMHKEAEFEFVQYVYDKSASQILYHRIAQSVSFDKNNHSYSELENELDYKVTTYLSIYNNMFYNYDENLLSKALNRIKLNAHGVSATLSHLYKDNFHRDVPKEERYSSYLTSTFGYVYNSHYSYNALYNYDIEKEELKSRGVGFLYKSRCLDFGIKYQENRRPITTNRGNSFINDKFIFFSILLKPIMHKSNNPLFAYKMSK